MSSLDFLPPVSRHPIDPASFATIRTQPDERPADGFLELTDAEKAHARAGVAQYQAEMNDREGAL